MFKEEVGGKRQNAWTRAGNSNSAELGFRASEGWFRGRQEVVIQTVVG